LDPPQPNPPYLCGGAPCTTCVSFCQAVVPSREAALSKLQGIVGVKHASREVPRLNWRMAP
jgi:hypothetical protein